MKGVLARTFLEVVVGGIAGTIATGPMTALMGWLHRKLPAHERYALPPHEITMKLAEAVGIKKNLSSDVRAAATLGALARSFARKSDFRKRKQPGRVRPGGRR